MGRLWKYSREELTHHLNRLDKEKRILTIDCYPGVRMKEIEDNLVSKMSSSYQLFSDELYYSSDKITKMIQYHLTTDRVFGRISLHNFHDFLDERLLEEAKETIESIENGLIIIYGVGASLIYQADILVYADLARWEIKKRYTDKEIPNWKANNVEEDPVRKIKRGYFFEWMVADRHKKSLYEQIDYLLDSNCYNHPKMITGANFLKGLEQTVNQPFKLVPLFRAWSLGRSVDEGKVCP